VICTLTAGGNTDRAETAIGRGDAWEVDRATLNAQITAALPASSPGTYACQRNGTGTPFPAAVARDIRIIAIEGRHNYAHQRSRVVPRQPETDRLSRLLCVPRTGGAAPQALADREGVPADLVGRALGWLVAGMAREARGAL
jgi:hypothetical protein